MTIRNNRVILDTNVWIFGLRHHPELPYCRLLLERLDQLQVILPRQVLRELQANLTESELRTLFRLLKQFSRQIIISWEKTRIKTIHKYQNIGCKLGDAIIAAHLEELGIEMLITENRHFLKELKNLPFRKLSTIEALEELEK
ncbi:MAG: type II toxin-antitoxin system VapC family toxin [Nitrospirota bacterium]